MDSATRHWRFLNKGEFDIAEVSASSYLAACDNDMPFRAIPVFLHRRFRHGFMFINTSKGIKKPADLKSRRIGVKTMMTTAVLWMRGILQSDGELLACAKALQNMLRRLYSLLEDPPYNFILHTAPPIKAQNYKPGNWETLPMDYHWHIELVPRLNQIAGFEWGSGFFINALPPESAAAFLREVDPDLEF